jgi:hypothetical protein
MSKIIRESQDPFLLGYLDAILFAETDENGNALDNNFTISDFSPKSISQAQEVCDQFETEAGDLLSEVATYYRAGMLFWFNRNGHGSGFWDEPSIDRRTGADKILSDLSYEFGECDVYVNDQGQIVVVDPYFD